MSGQVCFALSKVTNIGDLYLVGILKKDTKKGSTNAFNEYDQLRKEVLYTSVPSCLSLRETSQFILLKIGSLKRHAIDITYGKKLFENDITGAQISQTYDLSALRSILEEYTIGLIISSSRHSSLAISYKSTILLSCHHKIDVHISGTYFHLPCPFEFFSF